MVICPYCNEEVPEAKFCNKCSQLLNPDFPVKKRSLSSKIVTLGVILTLILVAVFLFQMKVKRDIVQSWQGLQSASQQCLTELSLLPDSKEGAEKAEILLANHLRVVGEKMMAVHRQLGLFPFLIPEANDVIDAFENINDYFQALKTTLADYSETSMEAAYATAPRVNDPRILPRILKGRTSLISVDQTITGQKKIRLLGKLKQQGRISVVIPQGESIDSSIPWELSQRYIDSSNIAHLTNEQLCTLRNSFYARYGYDFRGCVHLEEQFRKQPWYQPRTRNQEYIFNVMMNKYERANVLTIKQLETERGSPHLQSHLHDTYWYQPGR